MDRFPRRNTARNEWEDFEADDVWVFDPDADVEMSVNGDDDTSSGDGESDDDASDDDSMSSEDDDSNEDEDDEILERLEQNDPDLKEISLDYEEEWFPTSIPEWSGMGRMLGNNTHIKDLSIYNNMDGDAMSMNDERVLYAGLQNNRSIEKIQFIGTLPAMFMFVHPSNNFWKANKNLVSLCLNGLYAVGRQDMRNLCSVILTAKNLAHLEISYCMRVAEDEQDLFSILLNTLRVKSLDPMNGQSLKNLELQGNIIEAASMTNIVGTIQQYCPDLEELNVEDTTVGRHSCEAIASLLQCPSSRLSTVSLWNCEMTNDGALLLANALKRSRNSLLRNLNLGDNSITVEVREAFSDLICSKSSLMETVTSNHMLEDLGIILVDDLLSLNHSDDKRAVAMNKAIKFHLSELVVTMGTKLLPTIMACIGADQKDTCPEKFRRDLLVSMFSIVRSTPSLFEYASHESDQDLASDA